MLIAFFASVPGGAGANPWRSVSAPPITFALADYVMQPPGDAGAGDQDTTDTEPKTKEPVVSPSTGSTSDLQQPGSLRDTARTAVDTTRAFRPAAVETIGPPAIRTLPVVTPSSAPPVHTRHGVLGLAPIALLVGLVALHILIVTAVTK